MTISVGIIKGGDEGRVKYYLERAALCSGHRSKEGAENALGSYYATGKEQYVGQPNGGGRWMGRGARALALDAQYVVPESFAAAVLNGNLDGVDRAEPVLRTCPLGRVAAEPFAAELRQIATTDATKPEDLFSAKGDLEDFARLTRAAARFGEVPASVVDRLTRALDGKVNPARLYGEDEWAMAVKMSRPEHHIDVRTAAIDVVFSLPKSLSLVYVAGDESTRQTILDDMRRAVEDALDGFDKLAAVGVRGSKNGGTSREIETRGLTAATFVHDESRPAAGCVCGDPQLHTHAVIPNLVQGVDGDWSAMQHDRIKPAALTASYLFHADLRRRVTQSLGLEWQAPRNGLAELKGFSPAALRAFSKRRAEVEDALEEVGEAGPRAAQAATLATRQAKKTMPEQERLEHWLAEMAEHGIDHGMVDHLLGQIRFIEAEQREYDHDRDLVAGLAGFASSFNRRDVIRALAQECQQGESRRTIEDRADRILADPTLTSPLGAGGGGLTLSDLRTARGGRSYAYQVDQKWSSPEMLHLEAKLVADAEQRVGEGCAKINPDDVRRIVLAQPMELSGEQRAAVLQLTTSGNGVDLLQAGPGSGKTSAVLSTLIAAYGIEGKRIVGVCTSGKAAKVLRDETGMATDTVARFLIDAANGDGLGPDSVLVVDEASMTGSRDLAKLLDQAHQARAKVIICGDVRQLSAVDSGGGMRGLHDRLGAAILRDNRRQRESWEKQAIKQLGAGETVDALRIYIAHDRVAVVDSAPAAHRSMIESWWADAELYGFEHTLMQAARNVDRRNLNKLARAKMGAAGKLTGHELHAADRVFQAGDRVLLLKNARGRAYHNGDTATVLEVLPDRRLRVHLDKGKAHVIPAWYLDRGHVDYAYAATIHKSQGVTLETSHTLSVGLTKESGTVALTRGRGRNLLYAVQATAPDVEIDLPEQEMRTSMQQALMALERSKEKRLALDSAVSGAEADQLHASLAQVSQMLRDAPVDDTARLPGLRIEAEQVRQRIDASRRRLAAIEAEQPGNRWRRRQASPRAEQHRHVLDQLEAQLAAISRTIKLGEAGDTDRERWDAAHAGGLAAGVAAGRELAWRTRARVKAVEVDVPAYIAGLLGEPPTERARLEQWRRSVGLIEDFRRERGITDPNLAFGADHSPSRHQLERQLETDARAVERT